MQQIVANLAENARHAMAECPRRELLLRTREQGKYIMLSVQDSGSGMDEKTRAKTSVHCSNGKFVVTITLVRS